MTSPSHKECVTSFPKILRPSEAEIFHFIYFKKDSSILKIPDPIHDPGMMLNLQATHEAPPQRILTQQGVQDH